MRRISLLITVLFYTLTAFSQEEQNLKNNLLSDLLEQNGELKPIDFEATIEIKDEIISAARYCISSPYAEIEFQDLYKNDVAVLFHFRDVVENQMYLFVGDHQLQNAQCVEMTFKEVYDNYKLIGKTK